MTASRFSPADLTAIITATRLHSAVLRGTGPGHDRIDIMIPHQPGCSYRFERDAAGSTYLLHVSPDGLRLVTVGTLAECLGFFTPSSA